MRAFRVSGGQRFNLLLCGEPVQLSIHDIWTDGNFQLATCCAGLLEQIAAEIDADPAWGRALLRHLGAEELTGHVLRRVSDGQGNGPVLDFKLRLTPRFLPDRPRLHRPVTIDTADRLMRGGLAAACHERLRPDGCSHCPATPWRPLSMARHRRGEPALYPG